MLELLLFSQLYRGHEVIIIFLINGMVPRTCMHGLQIKSMQEGEQIL